MPIVIDETQKCLSHTVIISADNPDRHEYKLTNGLCRRLTIDDNDVLTLYSYDKNHHKEIIIAINRYYFFSADSHCQTVDVTEQPDNFSFVFQNNNIRELLKHLADYKVISRLAYLRVITELNEDPEHIVRQIKSIKTWESSRLQLNGFKTLSDDDIKSIVTNIYLRKGHFKYLELCDNGITDDQAIYLAKNLKHIYKIYLDDNAITDLAAAAIIRADKFLTVSFRNNKMILNKDNVVYDAALLNRYCTNIKLRGTGVSKALIINICEHGHSLKQHYIESFTHISDHDDYSFQVEEKQAARKQKSASQTEQKEPATQALTVTPKSKSLIKRLFSKKVEQPLEEAREVNNRRCSIQ